MQIEMGFLKVRTSLKIDGIEEVADIEIALLEAVATITPEDCRG